MPLQEFSRSLLVALHQDIHPVGKQLDRMISACAKALRKLIDEKFDRGIRALSAGVRAAASSCESVGFEGCRQRRIKSIIVSSLVGAVWSAIYVPRSSN
jgi:hypothetical protein